MKFRYNYTTAHKLQNMTIFSLFTFLILQMHLSLTLYPETWLRMVHLTCYSYAVGIYGTVVICHAG